MICHTSGMGIDLARKKAKKKAGFPAFSFR
ncbi:hypothetical protein ERHA54_40140 [Erwinia rhapontici]|uniref:Uncharacterized protein n=1 Tax=Erwinia rhapontici TaxID=55212 RepID=A0ABN6DP21_ERWRD|nr:hypothetical protein [Erwinia rhapontici]MCS3607872.1 hypothetical protein [Erwinia rhapontici]TDT00331.1 hypothetical protein EDF84_10251 [Erwinia rhapontici]BCQ36417.1 hypothetical protein ERHA53_37600 [Erwinia rhapontici]BCQ41411.1 hypothetical protein ERHA54_40140 [Erwinia rhapontici]